MTAIVTRGDAANLQLPDATVDLICTSPPYYQLRAYQDGGQAYVGQIGTEATSTEYLDALIACTAEWVRVLKPGGSIFVNLGDCYTGSGKGGNTTAANRADYIDERAGGYRCAATDGSTDSGSSATQRVGVRTVQRGGTKAPRKSLMLLPQRYAIRCFDELGLTVRADLIWDKLCGLPDNALDRAGRRHEYVFHLTRSPDYYYAPEERQPSCVWGIAPQPLKVPTGLGVTHIAAYPPELVRRIVLGWSPEGGVVLDPFGGSGTTSLVAFAFGRIGISVDLSADYCRLARWRTSDPGERARVLGIPKPEPLPDGQLGMFEGIGA